MGHAIAFQARITGMRRSTLGLALLSIGLIGCGAGGDNTANTSGKNLEAVTKPEDDAVLVVKMAPSDPPAAGGSIEVQSFKGGYGIDFFQKCADAYMKAHPGTTVKVDGAPEVWKQLKPRLAGGTPPDLMFPGWGFNHWVAAEEGQIFGLEDALNTPGADGKTPWKDTFEPGMLELGQLDGKQVCLPYYLMMYGWWYDPDVFAKNGWTAPKTWSELMTLGDKIKAKGMAPITFQGKYPYYLLYGMLMPWTISAGGMEAFQACQNMEPGAWKSPAVLKAAQMMVELSDKGFFQDGCVSMTHTEAQQEFLNGKAAMVPCGSWLRSEMKDQIKPGAKLAFMLPPVIDGGKGDPTAMQVDIEPWMVPVKSKNPQLAIDFYKFMTSVDNAKAFVKEKGTLMTIKGGNDVDFPEELKAPAEALKNSKAVYSIKFRKWYDTFEKEVEDSITALVTKKLTAEQFVDRLEKAAAAVREDETIKKHRG